MSVLALDLEDALARYDLIPGEETVHNCGRLIRILHILKTLKQQENEQQRDKDGQNVNIRFELPTNEDRGKIIRMGLKAATDNFNINGYKSIWEICDGKIEGELVDHQFVTSYLMEEKREMLSVSLEQEKLTLIASNMRPVLEELVTLKNQTGEYQSSLRTLVEYRQAWSRDSDVDLQYCQLYALTALFAAGATGSPEFLGPFATASWVRPEAHLAAGMHFFMKGQFEEALSSFQKMEPIESGVITAIISAKDAALYTALAAMATLPKRSPTAPPQDELTPEIVDYSPTSRDVLLSLRNCEYTSVMEFFEQARSRLLLDPFIAPVWTSIFRAVKRRAVIEFCSVFNSVTFSMISAGTGVDQTIQEIENLLLLAVQKNFLNGRLDLIDKVYTKRHVDPVSKTCQAAQSMATGAHRSAVQSAIIQARFNVSAPANMELAAQMAAKQDIE